LEFYRTVFRNVVCRDCVGVVINAEKSDLKVVDNRFENNVAREATCIYINRNKVEHVN